MLSQSNIDKLVLTGLYGHEPRKSKCHGDDPYWCTNWTFRIVKYSDGQYVMRDSYWNDYSNSLNIELTDENFDEFTFLFDFDKVTKVSEVVWCEYPEDKKFWAPTDSGGTYCGGSYFILKGAKPSIDLKREILLGEIHSAEVHLEYKRNELARLEADGMGGFYEQASGMTRLALDQSAQALACAVFIEAVNDIRRGTCNDQDNVIYFLRDIERFNLFCSWAQLNPEYVRAHILGLSTNKQGSFNF